MDTVRYSLCSISSWEEVAGFSCSLERLRAGEADLSLSREIWGDSLGGLSDSEGSDLSQSTLDTDKGVRILIGFSRTFPELMHTLISGGVEESVCNTSYLTTNKVSALWTWLFIASKIPELGDTAFIVLRKQKLIFLHWYEFKTVEI